MHSPPAAAVCSVAAVAARNSSGAQACRFLRRHRGRVSQSVLSAAALQQHAGCSCMSLCYCMSMQGSQETARRRVVGKRKLWEPHWSTNFFSRVNNACGVSLLIELHSSARSFQRSIQRPREWHKALRHHSCNRRLGKRFRSKKMVEHPAAIMRGSYNRTFDHSSNGMQLSMIHAA
jgi:hypothetical protein